MSDRTDLYEDLPDEDLLQLWWDLTHEMMRRRGILFPLRTEDTDE